MVEAMTTAAQIWKTLSNMYSRRENVMVMMEIQNKADAVKQAVFIFILIIFRPIWIHGTKV
jgi:hypothetical protein